VRRVVLSVIALFTLVPAAAAQQQPPLPATVTIDDVIRLLNDAVRGPRRTARHSTSPPRTVLPRGRTPTLTSATAPFISSPV
jgi:hypothetical protein